LSWVASRVIFRVATIHSETSPSTASTHTKRRRGETFTLQRLKLPPSPYKGLATTTVIESPQSGVARGTATVTRWRDREIVEPGVSHDFGALTFTNRRRR
jgi:hypothetical protein